jgi:hypothetical protein
MSDVTDRVLVALSAHDLEAFVDCYAEDATIEDGYDRVAARGHDELRARFGQQFAEYPELRVELISRTVVGEFVVQEEEVAGRGDHHRHVAVYLIEDGLIKRERLFA